MSVTDPSVPPIAPNRRWTWRRRAGIAMAIALTLLVVAVAAFPWFLGSAPARRWMLTRANRYLAPGGLDVQSFRFSWFGPTRLTGFVLIDPRGKKVVDSPTALWDRNLYQILFDGPRYGRLTLDRGALDIERRPDGSIDLAEALEKVLNGPDETDLIIHVADGDLRLRGPGLARPLVAEKADILIHRPSAPAPISWKLDLSSGTGADAAGLAIQGEFDRWGTPAADGSRNLDLTLTGRDWPFDLDLAGLSLKARYAGELAVRRREGDLRVVGRGDLRRFDLSGSPLAGDHLRLAVLGATWELERKGTSWSVSQLDVGSADLGSLRSRGTVPPSEGKVGLIEGDVDLAALARQLPQTLRLREGTSLEKGTATLRVRADEEGDRRAWGVEARVSDLIARNGESVFSLREPATLSARLVGEGADLSLAKLALKTPFLTASGSGNVDQGIIVEGDVDLGGLQRQLREVVDFRGVDLAGKGPLNASYKRSGHDFAAHLSLDLKDVNVQGLGPVALQRESARLDSDLAGPISATGFPQALASAHLSARAGEARSDLSAEPRGTATDLTLSAHFPLSRPDSPGRADVRLVGRLDADNLDMSEARLSLASEGEGSAKPLDFSAKGNFDRRSGTLSLRPLGTPVGALSLAPDGLHAAGLGSRNWDADLALVGDVAEVSRLLSLLDLSPASRQSGGWSARLSARSAEGGVRVGGKVEAKDLSAVEGPVSLAFQTTYRPDSDELNLSELLVSSTYATLAASGRIEDLRGRRQGDIRGSLTPDWKAINGWLTSRVDPGAKLAGQARPFHLRGPLGGEGLDIEAGFDLAEADIYGMKFGAAPIVFRRKAGESTIEPIETSLNGGKIRLEPKVVSMPDRGTAITLGPTSWISGAAINDEVSRRVLAFAAPVLEDATRVRGTISADIRHAEFPLVRDAGQKAVVEGDVVFRDVEFSPGPLAEDLLRLIARRDAVLRLDKPVRLAIADGRVETKGLALPVGNLTEIAIDGAVGFDRQLDLRATLPVTASLLGNSVVGDIVDGTRITIPISGTLSSPKIDRDAMRTALKDTGKDLLLRGATRGVFEILNRMNRPRDPNAPPPPTPRERRTRRLQERRGGIAP